MRVYLTLLTLALLYSCNGVKQSASVESGNQDATSESGLSYSRSTITANDTAIDNGDAMIVTVNLKDAGGAAFYSTVPLQVMFYTSGGTSRGTFSGSWDNGNGSYSAIFSGTFTGTATKIRALVGLRDIVTTYPSVTVQSAELAWNPAGHEFNFVPVMTTSPTINFVLSNSGNKAASSCGTPVISDTANFSIVGDTCGTSILSPGASCTVQVEAIPATIGFKQATLSRTCTNTGTISTFSQRIRVTGVNPVNTAWSPLIKNFGTVGLGNTSATETFTYTNTGTGTTIGCEIPVLSDPLNFKIMSDSCNRTNQVSGASCSVTVAAKPSVVGSVATTLSRTCTLGALVSTTSNGLTANAVLPVALVWAPLTKTFDAMIVGQKSGSFAFTLANTKTGTATGCSAPELSNSADFAITTDGCGTSNLGANASCQVLIQATPQSVGTLTTTLSRTCTFDGVASTTTNGVAVTASAATADPEWAQSGVQLGEITSGKSSTLVTLIYRNKGTLATTGCSAPTSSDPVNFPIVEDNCGTADVEGYGICTVKVSSSPPPGAQAATIQRVCTTGGTKSLILSATGATDTVLSITHGAGADHTCMLMSTGTVKCWGGNEFGQLGNGTLDPSPVPKSSLVTNAVDFSMQWSHGCAALTDGKVVCWGMNDKGQLGNGTKTNSGSPVIVKLNATTDLMDAVKVTTGQYHSCALLSSNKIFCWGMNENGQLGVGVASPASLYAKEIVNTVTAAYSSLSAGYNHTCAIDNITSGSSLVYCWGKNANGQIGDLTKVDKVNPTLVDNTTYTPRDAVTISLGGDTSCMVNATGVPSCWGRNELGQTGDVTTIDRTAPRNLPAVQPVLTIAPGFNHTCAVSTTNLVKCWGDNAVNQLGNDTNASSLTPGIIPKANGAVNVTVGTDHTCAQYPSGEVKCWGDNSNRIRLGDGNLELPKVPSKLATLANITDVAQGRGFVCALDQGGSVFCWGKNQLGQLGDGTVVAHATPGPVLGITTAVEVEAGIDFACAVLADTSVSCWGNNVNAGFGSGTLASTNIPTATGLTGVTSLKLGANGGCALMNNSTVKCWGLNQGDVGNNTTNLTSTPANVTGITTATAIAKGLSHSCALLSDKTVKCWGKNTEGQLGTGTTTSAFVPVALPNLTNISKINTRMNTTCAIMTDKTVKCWGQNDQGQVGDGTTINRTSPVSPGLADINEISAGGPLTCASNTSGKMFCFGNYLLSPTNRPAPTYGMKNVAIPNTLFDPCAIDTAGDLYCWGLLTPDLNAVKNVSGI